MTQPNPLQNDAPLPPGMYVKALCVAYCRGLVYTGFPRWPLASSYLGERSSRARRTDKLRKEVRSEIPELSSQGNWRGARRTNHIL